MVFARSRRVARAVVSVLALLPAGSIAAAPRRPPPTAPTPAAPVDARPVLEAARRALEDGLPQVAVHRFRQFLAANPPPAPGDRRAGTLGLARALLASGEARAALAALPAPGGGVTDPEVEFWRAQAHAALGEWGPALAGYERAGGDDDAARFGRAESLRGLGRGSEAARAFGELAAGTGARAADAGLRRVELALEAGEWDAAEAALRGLAAAPGADAPARLQARRFLHGCLLGARGRAEEAERVFDDMIRGDPRGVSERLLTAAQLARAQVLVARGRPGEAVAGLTQFLDRYPRNGFLEEVFARLQTLRATENAPDLTDLARWARDDAEPARQAPAALALARERRREGRLDSAEQILFTFPEQFPQHPLRTRAALELADLHLSRRQPGLARAALRRARAWDSGSPEFRRGINALEARVDLAQGEFGAAATRLQAVADAPGTPRAEAEGAAFQAALAQLRAGDEAGYALARATFAGRFPGSALGAELPLEEGLIRAANAGRSPWPARAVGAAAQELNRFLWGQPGSPRAAEARLALAELAFANAAPDDARRELQTVAGDLGAPAPTAERADALAVWLADAPGPGRDEEVAVNRARAFLARRPDSALAAAVRMKLGEIYFRKEDYPDAQTELELVGWDAGAPALYEGARYLAGLAALRGMSPAGADRAVGLFEEAARVNGPLRLPARLRQAETLRDRLGKPVDALLVYDAVLSAAPAGDAETRCAALCGRGETLLSRDPADPVRAADAARAFGQAAAVPGAPVPWRRQALARQGDAFEKVGDTVAALAAYDDALNAGDGGAPDFTWFYRAGFSAARLLRAAGQWSAAVAVYGKIAAVDGPLRGEAETQAGQLRLEHFLWNDEG